MNHIKDRAEKAFDRIFGGMSSKELREANLCAGEYPSYEECILMFGDPSNIDLNGIIIKQGDD